ncbi:transglutaminase domain-containing protein [Halorubrum lipolyticum]|uniref:Transglutaminase-like enzyme, cysteine protease n=1 Tax=Halorubrum lipolyticum DSM 21995 TaxID=1227482 RepID=M0NNP8_9EURY|nr:transglutaminase domain-containing protein [Halorubrum lipolyticum]EMA59243.1 transglutaminase-like enzyme, cysteine protease [Halorubrum lipolyticum DSM 21995]
MSGRTGGDRRRAAAVTRRASGALPDLGREEADEPAEDWSGFADPAVLGVALVTAAYLGVFLEATDVVGGTARTAAAVSVAGVAGAVLARVVTERTAVRLTAVLLAAALAGYYFAVPASRRALFSVEAVAIDVVSLLTGLSVLRLALADVWILAVAPAPTFLVAYLAGRGRHVGATAVAGGTLGFLVCTGDAGGLAALVGVVGAALAAGFATLSTPDALRAHGDRLTAVLAAMILVSATVTVLPAGAAQPWGADRGPTLESSLGGGDEVEVIGATRLSPQVRYEIESPVASNWHVAAYDTYTGDGWVRSGGGSTLDGSLDGPPGEATTVNATLTARTESTALPAPWQAVDVRGAGASTAQVDERGTLRLGAALRPGEATTVESRVLDAEPAELRNASTEYDPAIEDRYTQLPESTPDRVGERTEAIVEAAGAENPYDRAAAIERYLIEEYDYSLGVEKPEGDVADAFLFEMDAGYCTYFATTMVAMLRSQGIPAQFATGYAEGERVGEDRYVVRGQDAHAWVKVYFPEHGWVEFDPTPASERDEARSERLAEARETGEADVDTEETEPAAEPGEPTPTPEPEADSETDAEADAPEANGSNGTDGDGTGDATGIDASITEEGFSQERLVQNGTPARGDGPGADEGGDGGLPLPSREAVAYWLFVVTVAVVGARRLGLTERARRAVRVRAPWGRGEPVADAKRAFDDLEGLLARRYRERRPGETPRAYLDALPLRDGDERARAVGETYERAAYAGSVTREEADEARRTVRRLALERTPLIGRLFDRG